MAGKGKHVAGDPRGKLRFSCLFWVEICLLGDKQCPGGVSVCKGMALVFADPSANPGSGCLLSTEAPAACQEGILGYFVWKPRWLRRARQELSCPRALCVGRQGSGAADGSDINRVAPAGLAEPSILCRHTVVLLCLSQAAQGASKIPFHILPPMFRLHHSSGSPTCRILPEEASCAQNPTGTCARDGLRCLQCMPGLAGTTDPSMLLPVSSSSGSSALPGRAQAGMLQAALEQASAGHVPGGRGARRRQSRCR